MLKLYWIFTGTTVGFCVFLLLLMRGDPEAGVFVGTYIIFLALGLVFLGIIFTIAKVVRILATTVFARNQVKYGERGMRYMLMETGHIAQNVYLVSAALGLKICTIGGFVDRGINKQLDLDEEYEATVYLMCLGQ